MGGVLRKKARLARLAVLPEAAAQCARDAERKQVLAAAAAHHGEGTLFDGAALQDRGDDKEKRNL